MNFFDNFKKKNLIAAHRGHSNDYPENTKIAFENSLGKADLIEFDVQFSKDMIPVIFHDDKLTRISDITEHEEFAHRKPYYIFDFDYDELIKLDMGANFKKNEIKEKQKILTLDEVLDFAIKNKIYLNIEIKDVSNTNANNFAVSIVLKSIEKYKCENMVLVSSFNHNYLEQIKDLNKTISTAALVYKFHPDNIIQYLKNLKVCAYNIDNETVTKDLVNSLKEEGIFVNVYTANLKKRKKKLFDMGVKIVFTDCLN